MPEETAIVPHVEPETKPDALAQVASNLASLAPKVDALAVVSAKSLAEVLPSKFYEGASQLMMTDTEKAALKELQDATDDEIEIRPDGLIYVEHITVRRALTKVFGSEWACLPGSPVVMEKTSNAVLVCQRWVLVVRGCYVGEAIGAGSFYENNIKQNKTDAAEAACSEAIRRICAKTALGICSNVFQKATARRWRKEFAVQVWVNVKNEQTKMWRRIDADKFEGETGPVDDPAKEKGNEAKRQRSGSSTQGGGTAQQEGGKAHGVPVAGDAGLRSGNRERANEAPSATTPDEGHAPEWAEAEVVTEPKPVERHVYAVSQTGVGCAICGKAMTDECHIPGQIRDSKPEPAKPAPSMPTEPMVTAANWRVFIFDCRSRGLINGDVALGAISFLAKDWCKDCAMHPGKKPIENLNAMFKTLTAAKFNEMILKLRELAAKGASDAKTTT